MRHFPRYEAAALTLLLGACSAPQPPVGHWQGAYEDPALMIVAWLEIDSAGRVRVSAPNAIMDRVVLNESERAELHARLENGLASSWKSVAPIALEFDGHVFHKPGGVAPQLEWDGAAKRMTLIYYSGNRPSVRVPLEPVADFDAPP